MACKNSETCRQWLSKGMCVRCPYFEESFEPLEQFNPVYLKQDIDNLRREQSILNNKVDGLINKGKRSVGW